jgi:hypothetical protein
MDELEKAGVTRIVYGDEVIDLKWCRKHKNWWITKCPDCVKDESASYIKKGEPPILSDEEIKQIILNDLHSPEKRNGIELAKDIARAQRDADKKWYEGIENG